MRLRLLFPALAATLACSGVTSSPAPVTCGAVRLTHLTGLTNPHVATCGDPTCGNGSNPPVGGPHCPSPLSCQSYASAQPRCAWIHNLEHGHAVLAYNCPQGCPALVQQLQTIANGVLPGSNGVRRVLITPDPDLDHTVAAVVWGWSWVGDSVDSAAIQCLLSHQDQDAPELGLDCAAP